MDREICLTEDVKDRGYSGVLFHEDDLVSVTVASTNDYNHDKGRHDHLPMITFYAKDMYGLVSFRAGEPYYSEFRALTSAQDRTNYIYDLILKNLTPGMLIQFLRASHEKGVKDGRNSLRRELKNLMQEEW